MDELNKIIDRYTEGNYLFGKTAREEMAKDILALFNVVGRSEQLEAFAQFLYDKEYLVRRSIDESIDEFEKSL